MKKILKRKKTLIILGTCIVILGLTFGTVSIAQNYYKSSGSSEKEKEEYQMAQKEKERLKDRGTYNPKGHIKKEDLAQKAENVADVFDMSVSEAEKRITKNSIEKKALSKVEYAKIKVHSNVYDLPTFLLQRMVLFLCVFSSFYDDLSRMKINNCICWQGSCLCV